MLPCCAYVCLRVEKVLRDSVILYEDGTPRTQHATTNIAVHVDEEAGAAAVSSYVTVFQALPTFRSRRLRQGATATASSAGTDDGDSPSAGSGSIWWAMSPAICAVSRRGSAQEGTAPRE